MALVIEHLNIASPAMPLQKLSHLLDLLLRVRADSFILRRGIDFANRRIWRLQPTSQETGKNRGLCRLRIGCLLHCWIPMRERRAPLLIQNAGPHLQ